MPLLKAPGPAEIRDELAELVVKDLHGPAGGPDEELRDRPIDHYILGRLAPNGVLLEPEENDRLADADADAEAGDTEPEAPNIPSMFPSSYGFTAHLDGSARELEVTASWGRYRRGKSSDSESRVWRREQMSGTFTLKLAPGRILPVQLDPEQPEIVVRGRTRKIGGDWVVTLFLVNARRAGVGTSDAWIFQAELSVRAPDGAEVFRRRPVKASGGDPADRAEQQRLAMLYRFHPEIAVGHGTAVHITPGVKDRRRAVRVSTAAVPSHELQATDVPSAEHDPDLPELADLVLDMARLATFGPAELTAALTPLVDGYRAWLDRAEASLDTTRAALEDYRDEAVSNLSVARRAADRIEHGIELLTRDEQARRAFQFANEAMHRQRVRSIAAAARRKDPRLDPVQAVAEADQPENRSWRPFQLAFLLLNLPSLADPEHPERGEAPVADLLWFPTGGGKTEAYLGLTSFTLAIRRLGARLGGYDAEHGVAVLMRYTLRLLTIQQFQRAAALICACEVIRREHPDIWGSEPFRLGLWVGGAVTPNKHEDAVTWTEDRRRTTGRPRSSGGSPHQLTSCPWCGEAIEGGRDIAVDKTSRRTFINCSRFDCDFNAYTDAGEGLPVLVVDEEIYRLGPSMVIATVDKFAQLAWQGATQTLFGRAALRCERHGRLTEDLVNTCCGGHAFHHPSERHPAARHVPAPKVRPPDLIIQDELHLISGPLGSLVGLYETAVDRLCTWELPGGRRVRPKVIASTATVRRANKQISALFDRPTTEVFPPPGLTADDNFFARQRPVERKPGRRYIGICAHGVRIKSTLIRTYVAVLGAAQLLHEKYGANPVTDPYMTMVGYFNSLRDLGGMRRLVEDDVSTRLARADQRGLARRYDPLLRELTSRLSSVDIPDVLAQLEVPFGEKPGRARQNPIDVLLATNMIAVGVDVSRLGVMVVANQPKSTAEYIQATSRVGRAAPGLVFTVYNWARPRDLSHYERFENYHMTAYRHVEALSVTPFAYRAVDRGLTGVLVALVRNLETTYNANLSARKFDRLGKLADHVVAVIRRRAANVVGKSKDEVDVERALDVRLDHWSRERLVPHRRLAYRTPLRADDIVGLLKEPGSGRWQELTCPTSLREVEPGVRLLLLDTYDLGSEGAPPFTPREEQP